jgi:membrane-bound lytic murein transglycosylase B
MRRTAFRPALTLLAWAAAVPFAGFAQTPFESCVARLKTRAIDAGIQAATVERALADVRPLERVIREDRNQPEFVTTFADYFERRVTAERIETGRRLLAQYGDELSMFTARYGVPAQYLVALWGLETNYGRVLGNVPVFDSLTTLACDDRRADYFGAALVDALTMVDRGHVQPEQMMGSWAGAMGHTQFMPAAYLAYAADGDGDGRIDLWRSPLDALASGANYLSTLRWQTGLRWGREVRLPEAFDYAEAGLDRSRPLREWRALGVADVGGRALPDLDLAAALLVPSGHAGPAFIVYDNFQVIMRWNRSEHFALVVGHLADRIAGAGALRTPPVRGVAMTREELTRVQTQLTAHGYDTGTADGLPGPATRAAIRAYQRDNAMIADGHLHAELLEALDIGL